MHLRSQLFQASRPITATTEIGDRNSHPGRALVAHQFNQMVLRAAAIDPGDNVKNLHAGTS